MMPLLAPELYRALGAGQPGAGVEEQADLGRGGGGGGAVPRQPPARPPPLANPPMMPLLAPYLLPPLDMFQPDQNDLDFLQRVQGLPRVGNAFGGDGRKHAKGRHQKGALQEEMPIMYQTLTLMSLSTEAGNILTYMDEEGERRTWRAAGANPPPASSSRNHRVGVFVANKSMT